MKLKILRTILFYLSIIILSCYFYLKEGFIEVLGFLGIMILASVVYLWVEYDSVIKEMKDF